jgi:hypothetical protein
MIIMLTSMLCLTCDIRDCLLHEVWGYLDTCHLTQVQVAKGCRHTQRHLCAAGGGTSEGRGTCG